MILLLDDDTALTVLYRRLLETRAYQCVEFDDPALALRSFRGSPSLYQAAVLDVWLPGAALDGLAVALAMREMRPNLPIMFATGLEDGYNLARLSAVGLVMRKRLPVHMAEDLWRLLDLI